MDPFFIKRNRSVLRINILNQPQYVEYNKNPNLPIPIFNNISCPVLYFQNRKSTLVTPEIYIKPISVPKHKFTYPLVKIPSLLELYIQKSREYVIHVPIVYFWLLLTNHSLWNKYKNFKS